MLSTASEWVVRMSRGPLSPEEQRLYLLWLAEDETRSADIRSTQQAWQLAGNVRKSAKAIREWDRRKSELVREKRSRTLRRRIAWISAPAFIAGILMLLWSAPTSTLPRLDNQAVAQTPIGKIEYFELPDRSHLTIAADSLMQVAFTGSNREMLLSRGEAFFEVRADASRPFIIKAGDHQVRVTGTKFNVNYDTSSSSMEVAVVEGAVVVTSHPRGQIQDEHVISAGQVVLVPSRGPLVYRRLTPSQASAWRDRQLYFEDARLSEILLEVNRYSSKPIVSMDPAINDLTLTGQFEAGDPADLLFSLSDIYKVEARDTPGRWELRTKAD